MRVAGDFGGYARRNPEYEFSGTALSAWNI
jgi:hypothetical protein